LTDAGLEGRPEMNIEKYIARIGLENTGSVGDLASLKLLQRQHLLNVPFENLDIHWRRPIVMDTDAFYQKIVESNRGGFCYELNGSFNELLRETGFETRLLSARVAESDGGFSAEYDHMAILVLIGEMQYLADVGFGAFTAGPLQFVVDVEQEDETGVFVIKSHELDDFLVAKREGDIWRSEYIFKPLGHDLSEFANRCEWHQTSPDSHFTKGKICSIMTLTGRKTLTDDRFIVTDGDARSETPVTSNEEFEAILLTEFGISRSAVERGCLPADQFIR
jgi:N-hydroxyarylamine O-acetyltransferase